MASVQVKCLKCSHEAELDVVDDVSIARLSRKLVCSECGSRAMLAQRIEAAQAVKHR